jgi:hypothetical protein
MATSTTPQPYAADPPENPPRAWTLTTGCTVTRQLIGRITSACRPPFLPQIVMILARKEIGGHRWPRMRWVPRLRFGTVSAACLTDLGIKGGQVVRPITRANQETRGFAGTAGIRLGSSAGGKRTRRTQCLSYVLDTWPRPYFVPKDDAPTVRMPLVRGVSQDQRVRDYRGPSDPKSLIEE